MGGDRPVLADNRASAGFRPSIKEMLYPIVAERAQGSRFWDVDGNEYVDLAMGFGVHLFGHHPPFIREAIHRELDRGALLGPHTALAGDVARRIQELTGVERVAFTASGTEAVMVALRLARAVTGRRKVALFAGSYHGHADSVLGVAGGEHARAAPAAPGITAGAVADLVVFEYGAADALEAIAKMGDELAAVLVEPVQSRRPGLQPRAFLHELRDLTHKHDVALVFDEMITGFRVAPGGAQAHFDIAADLVTYGKVVGGGMPIGIVAGQGRYLDAIDGGLWQYGDDSYPRVEPTWFAGTFYKHPLVLAAARAATGEIATRGPALQDNLNRCTTALAERLNRHFEAQDHPLRVAHFGSLFRFEHSTNLDLFYLQLLKRGVYTWEGRTCFLSTAHDDRDLALVESAVCESLEELREGGHLGASQVPARALPPTASTHTRVKVGTNDVGPAPATHPGSARRGRRAGLHRPSADRASRRPRPGRATRGHPPRGGPPRGPPHHDL